MGSLFYDDPRPMWVYDSQSLCILDVNDAALRLYAYPREVFLAMTIFDLRPESERPRLAAAIAQGFPPMRRSGPWTHRTADGSLVEVEITSHDLLLGDRPAVVVTAEEVGERNRLQAEVHGIEKDDPLTGLPGRGFLLAELARRTSGGRTGTAWLCLVHFEADGFPLIDDLHGSGGGVLRRIGDALTEMAEGLIAVAHLRDGEFALAATVTEPSEGIPFATGLLDRLAARLPPDESTTLTGGVAMALACRASGADLLRDAITATSWAKSHKRGHVASYEEASASLAFKDELRVGIANRELVTHYQPVVSLADDRIVGAEALVRWDRPGIGLVGPDQFVPVAEECRMIGDVWRFVLEDSLAQLAQWRTITDLPLWISLNLSARQFDDPCTVDHFVATLGNSTIDPGDIVVEITETAAASDPERMHEVLSALRLLEVRIALDDFGTGYSTLAELERTPFDLLKLDRCFISRLDTDRRQWSMVSGIVELAHALGMTVVAEGVERPAQLTELRHLGVDLAQGFHLGRPVDGTAFNSLLARRHLRDRDHSPCRHSRQQVLR
jgi:PAS domain S-box-containing protein